MAVLAGPPVVARAAQLRMVARAAQVRAAAQPGRVAAQAAVPRGRALVRMAEVGVPVLSGPAAQGRWVALSGKAERALAAQAPAA